MRFDLLAGIQEAVNGVCELAVEDAHRPDRDLEQAVPAGSFHQLYHAATTVHLHDDEGLASTLNANQLTWSGNPAGKEIRFNDDA